MRLRVSDASGYTTPLNAKDDEQKPDLPNLTNTPLIFMPEQCPLKHMDIDTSGADTQNTKICPMDEDAILREIRKGVIAAGNEKIARINGKLAFWDQLETRWDSVKRKRQRFEPERYKKNEALMDHRRESTVILRNEKVRMAVVIEGILGRMSCSEQLGGQVDLTTTSLEKLWGDD